MEEIYANMGFSILYQVAIIVSITYALSTIIAWLLEVEKHNCKMVPKTTFDIGSFFCWSCIYEFFDMFNVIPKRQTLGFYTGCFSLAFYLVAVLDSTSHVKGAFVWFLIGQILSLIAVVAAFGLHIKPHSDVVFVISAIGFCFYVPGQILMLFKYYIRGMMMMFVGGFNYLVAGFLYVMHRNLKTEI